MLHWHWTPDDGGLLANVSPEQVAHLLPVDLPHDGHPVRPLHLTFLRSASMKRLVGVLETLPELPALPLPELIPAVHVATRPPKLEREPPGSPPRRTGFVAVRDQARCHAVLAEVVRRLDAASRARGGPAFPHPEPDRFFHLSVWNNRGGDARRSIGDIGAHDLGGGACA